MKLPSTEITGQFSTALSAVSGHGLVQAENSWLDVVPFSYVYYAIVDCRMLVSICSTNICKGNNKTY